MVHVMVSDMWCVHGNVTIWIGTLTGVTGQLLYLFQLKMLVHVHVL